MSTRKHFDRMLPQPWGQFAKVGIILAFFSALPNMQVQLGAILLLFFVKPTKIFIIFFLSKTMISVPLPPSWPSPRKFAKNRGKNPYTRYPQGLGKPKFIIFCIQIVKKHEMN